MNTWRWLGIEPTSDLKAIKKAYANMSKKYHPEEHPDEFKQLQNAYKEAVRYAKGSQNSTNRQSILNEMPVSEKPEERVAFQNPELSNRDERESVGENKYEKKREEAIGQKGPQMDNPNTAFYSYEEIPQVFSEESREERFFRQLEYMLWHPYMRDSVPYWKCFLQGEEYGDLMRQEAFRDKLLQRLCQENYFFYYEVRDYLVALWKPYTDEDIKSLLIKDRILILKRGCYTDSEKKIYDQIWNRSGHLEGKNAKNYLKEYFRYAEANEERLMSVYRDANQARQQRKQNKKSIRKIIRYILVFLFFSFLGLRRVGIILVILMILVIWIFIFSNLFKKK